MAASRVAGNEKPVVGLNSDPSRSEGYLCLPVKYSTNIREAIDKLLKVSMNSAPVCFDHLCNYLPRKIKKQIKVSCITK